MINFDEITGENQAEHYPKYISGNRYRILIVGALDQEKLTHY